MATRTDLTTEFMQKLRTQIADALENVDFSSAHVQHGLHLRGASRVSLGWSDRVATLQRVELMRKISESDKCQSMDRSVA